MDVREVFRDRRGEQLKPPELWHQHAEGGLIDSRGQWRLQRTGPKNWSATVIGRNGRAQAQTNHPSEFDARQHAGSPSLWSMEQRGLIEEYTWTPDRFRDRYGEEPYNR